MESFQKELEKSLGENVHFDLITRRVYSVDASIYEVEPLAVALPRNRKELLQVLKIANAHNIPVTARGAATGITGGCIGPGLIVDLSKYLRHIIEINYDKEYAICEPGVVQDELNAELSARGYRLGPDTSTGNRATLGGMVANNAAGARSLRYGCMVDHVEEVKLALYDGTVMTLKALSEEEQTQKRTLDTQEGEIYRAIHHIQEEYATDIEEHFPKIPRRVSGYNLDALIKNEPLNLSKIAVGSEGTLGIAVEIKVRISKKPKVTGLCLIHCTEIVPAMEYIPQMLRHHPLSLEMIDAKILQAGRSHPSIKGKLEWLNGDPAAIYIAEFDGEDLGSVQEKLAKFAAEMEQLSFGYAYPLMTDPRLIQTVWEVRKAGLGLLLSKRSYMRAIAFIEDVTVAPPALGPFMKDFTQCLKSYGKEAGIYGHVGAGCMHIRPYINLSSPEEQKLMESLMREVAELLLRHRGALSGEHGDGYVRSWLNEKMFGPRVYQAFCALKRAFDPKNQMNPGKIVDGPKLLHDLRSETNGVIPPLKTFLNFSREGGFELAADLCNGNGLCRKREGVMCPSFQATNDEYDTTRARAQALRALTHGHLPREALYSQELYDVLDLCLQCKGCKSECPSQVDMAKMKSEFLYHYHEKHGYPLRTRLFAHFGKLNNWVSPFASLVNFCGNSALGKRAMRWLGIAPARTLPPVANERFSTWMNRQKRNQEPSALQVILFSDTYTEFNHPEIGKAAVKVLQALGYHVIVPSWNCCGRTLYSKGMLQKAKEYARVLLHQLSPFARQGLPIVVLEPSCLSMVTEDFTGFFGDNADLIALQSACVSFDAFLLKHRGSNGELTLPLNDRKAEYLLHVHCHEKSTSGAAVPLAILRGLPGANAALIDSGCCGMAGAFGYEHEHYAISMKIGSLKLFPEILKAKDIVDLKVVANGISCRQQIKDGTGVGVLHLAEAIAEKLIVQ